MSNVAEILGRFPPEQVPVRSHMDDPKIKWRVSKPNYDVVNSKYLSERTREHASDSLEKVVENLFKTFEMEAGHKLDPKDWGCIVPDGSFRFKTNNGRWHTTEELIKVGTYNAFLMQCPFYSAATSDFETSHTLFKTCFSGGFAWELLEVYANLPVVNLKWRHWSHFTGPYNDNPATGELLEIVGTAIAIVDSDLKIKQLEFYYDPNPFMMTLNGGKVECPHANKQK